MDIRGHGKSQGKRGYFEDMNVILEDYKNFINTTESMYKDKTDNKFVLGYSLGGLFSNIISLAMPHHFNGMIMIAPPLSIDVKQYDFWLKVGNVLRNIFPSLPLVKLKCKLSYITIIIVKIESNALSEYFKSDPLIYKGRLRIGTAFTILESIKYSNDNIDQVSTPFYILHGAQDKDCDAKGSTKFYDKSKIIDKTLILHDSILF